MDDPANALVPGSSVHIEGADGGPLSGLCFVAKDLFDIAGHPTGAGNPDWPRFREVPDRHAWVVERLLEAGADLVGKSITDEISLGILGENMFDGTPVNAAAPDRVPGGSSSGSAAAVAARMCDFAIGTDTGGSVRVPASFCGLYGIRPTHGRINLEGMLPQAPSSDTAGWLARDATTFAAVGDVLLQQRIPTALPKRLLIASDAFGFAESETAAALQDMVYHLGTLIGQTESVTMAPQGLSVWAKAQRVIQPHEGWLTFKDWIERCNPRMAYTVARNLFLASTISPSDLDWAQLMRREARARLNRLLADDAILCMPTTPFPAPPKELPVGRTDFLRQAIACLCSHGGLTGMPQVSIPGATVGGLPVGLSILGPRDGDATLIAVAEALAGGEVKQA